MKLLNDFFTILEISSTESGFIAEINLNTKHLIFNGHFPGHPVTPGVIQLQMIQELIEFNQNKKCQIIKITHVKYLNIVDPTTNPNLKFEIRLTINEEAIHIKAFGFQNEMLFLNVVMLMR